MLLEVVNLTKQYTGNRGIQGLNLTVSEGEVVALLGSNGAGKTTAMKAMMGLTPADSGAVSYKGISILDRPEKTKNEIGMMIGDPFTLPISDGVSISKNAPESLLRGD